MIVERTHPEYTVWCRANDRRDIYPFNELGENNILVKESPLRIRLDSLAVQDMSAKTLICRTLGIHEGCYNEQ